MIRVCLAHIIKQVERRHDFVCDYNTLALFVLQ